MYKLSYYFSYLNSSVFEAFCWFNCLVSWMPPRVVISENCMSLRVGFSCRLFVCLALSPRCHNLFGSFHFQWRVLWPKALPIFFPKMQCRVKAIGDATRARWQPVKNCLPAKVSCWWHPTDNILLNSAHAAKKISRKSWLKPGFKPVPRMP